MAFVHAGCTNLFINPNILQTGSIDHVLRLEPCLFVIYRYIRILKSVRSRQQTEQSVKISYIPTTLRPLNENCEQLHCRGQLSKLATAKCEDQMSVWVTLTAFKKLDEVFVLLQSDILLTVLIFLCFLNSLFFMSDDNFAQQIFLKLSHFSRMIGRQGVWRILLLSSKSLFCFF